MLSNVVDPGSNFCRTEKLASGEYLKGSSRFQMAGKLSLCAFCTVVQDVVLSFLAMRFQSTSKTSHVQKDYKKRRFKADFCTLGVDSSLFSCVLVQEKKEIASSKRGDRNYDKKKKMDSRGIEPRTTPRIEFEALCASEMLREYYTTKPRARELSCYSFDGISFSYSYYNLGNIDYCRNAV